MLEKREMVSMRKKSRNNNAASGRHNIMNYCLYGSTSVFLALSHISDHFYYKLSESHLLN